MSFHSTNKHQSCIKVDDTNSDLRICKGAPLVSKILNYLINVKENIFLKYKFYSLPLNAFPMGNYHLLYTADFPLFT